MEAAWGPALASSTMFSGGQRIEAFPHIQIYVYQTYSKKKKCLKNCRQQEVTAPVINRRHFPEVIHHSLERVHPIYIIYC
jgi:hypothetical protein